MKSMEKKSDNELENLSTVKKMALKILDNIKFNVVHNCSEEELLTSMAKLDAKSNGYVNPKEMLTYDKAMNMLGIRNRNTFSTLCKKHNIKNVKINNMSVGFHKSDIDKLKQIINTN